MKKIVVALNEVLDVLGDSVIKIYGLTEGVHIDNLSDSNHVTEMTLDWVNPGKKDKQTIVENSAARTILVDQTIDYNDTIIKQNKTLLVVENPKKAIQIIGNTFFNPQDVPSIHPTALIDPNAKIGKNVYIGPYVVIGEATIGDNCHISPFVKIYDDVQIGHDCIVKEGAVIGGAGFGYQTNEDGNRERFPQIGGVIIGNYVDIGANSCIDRGALSDTRIGNYTKIDNLVHIAHNVVIGQNAMIIACSEISGSCEIEDYAWVGPNTSVREWQHIGKNVLTGIGSVVVKNIPDDEIWAGNPAKKIK